MTDDEIDRHIEASERVLTQMKDARFLVREAIGRWIDSVGPEHPLRREAMQSLVDGPAAQANFLQKLKGGIYDD